jgi:5-methyltetrahydropteroyltriglutamate--homocysteine methyltransferase
MLLPTCLVGSYPQPDWLIDRQSLAKQMPPRVRARELWRIAPDVLEAAQDDATLVAVHEQERAGLDIVTDGEQRRESYSNRFATALEGVDVDNPGKTPNCTGGFAIVPRTSADPRRHPVEARPGRTSHSLLRHCESGMIILTALFGAAVERIVYRDEEALALDYAAAVNAEIMISCGGRRRGPAR